MKTYLDGVVVRRAANVGATTITLVDIIDPKTPNAGVCLSSTEESGKDREESNSFNHFE
jgi:hypothetical protein